MIDDSRDRGRRRRVYYAVLVALLVLGVTGWAASRVAPARGQVDVTVDAVMVKGAVDAPVTIIEFSDYQ